MSEWNPQALGDGKLKPGFHLSTNPKFQPACEQPTGALLEDAKGECVKSYSESLSGFDPEKYPSSLKISLFLRQSISGS